MNLAGSGEVVRYLGTYGSAGVSKAVLIGSIPPYLLQAGDNPQGVPREVFEGLKAAVVADRYTFLDSFLGNLYNTDVSIPERLSESALRASSQVAYGSGPYATYACIDTGLTDFRGDLPKIDIPVLAVHGVANRLLAFAATTGRLRDEGLIDDLTVVEVADGPHNVGWTYPDEVNAALLDFRGGNSVDRAPTPARAVTV